jgi:hypothetical protein
MPYDFLTNKKQSFLSPDPLKKPRLYTEVNRNKLTIDPKALFLHEPPTNIGNVITYPFDSKYRIVTDGLSLYLDASYSSSYAGDGANWLDISGNTNNFTLYNSPTFETNKLTFNINGAQQYAQCNNNTFGNYGSSSFTMEYFFNLATAPNTNNQYSTLFIKRGSSISIATAGIPGWTFNPGGNGYAGFVSWMDSSGVPNTGVYRIDYGTSQIPENANTHIIHTVERNGLQVTGSWYKNGVFESRIQHVSLGDGSYNNSVSAQVMRSPFIETYRSGSVYLIRSYDRSLSQSEITQNYNATIGRLGL